LQALRSRKERKDVEAANAADAKADDSDDGDVPKTADPDKLLKKRPAASAKHVKPGAAAPTKKLKRSAAAKDRSGCPKFRGGGGSICRDPKYTGTRITQAEYKKNEKQRKLNNIRSSHIGLWLSKQLEVFSISATSDCARRIKSVGVALLLQLYMMHTICSSFHVAHNINHVVIKHRKLMSHTPIKL